VLFYVFLTIISSKLQYIIGIDCGATASEAVISTHLIIPSKKAQRDLLRKRIPPGIITMTLPKKYPPVNFNILGFELTADRLIHIIKDISKSAGLKNVLTVVAGVSGARYEKDRKKLESFIKNKTRIKHVKILPDTEIAFASAFPHVPKGTRAGKPGQTNCGILIAGTGSILYYKDSKGKTNRVGGWGRLIGDEGSGWWIARTALSHVTKNYDKRGKKTLLTELLKKHFSINGNTIINKIYHEGFVLSKIAKIVFLAASKGDKICMDIIKSAASELAEHFFPVKNKKYTIALMGSLFSEEKLLELELKKIIKSEFPNISIIKPNFKPVWGAVRIANSILGEARQSHL